MSKSERSTSTILSALGKARTVLLFGVLPKRPTHTNWARRTFIYKDSFPCITDVVLGLSNNNPPLKTKTTNFVSSPQRLS
ncbi:unnamed protein product [Linum trigynum]|uniref:Uncharacterized protein n=1 Tax=Linum trigynum TaxID=586398 RepID=A0AAV2DWD9_9ROSI